MPIKPIDLQNVVVKTQQLSKVEQNENNRNKNTMHNQVVRQNNLDIKKNKQVIKTSKSYKSKIDREKDKKNNSNNESRKKKNKNNKKEKEQKKCKSLIGHNIDIKI